MITGYGMDTLHDGDLQPEAWGATNAIAFLCINGYTFTPTYIKYVLGIVTTTFIK